MSPGGAAQDFLFLLGKSIIEMIHESVSEHIRASLVRQYLR
jgi:hypothetical protein